MSPFLEKVRALILAVEVQVSEQGYDELAEERISMWIISRDISLTPTGSGPSLAQAG